MKVDKYYNKDLYIDEDKPYSVTFNITSKCDHKCIHCYYDRTKNIKFENGQSIIKLAEEIRDIEPANVCICGGEPLLSNHLYDILSILSSSRSSISISTNGYLLSHETIKKLISMNVTAIQLSLDGYYSFQHDLFRRKANSYNRVIMSIKMLAEFKDVKKIVACSLNKMNYNNIVELYNYMNKLNVDVLKLSNIVPMGRAKKMNEISIDSLSMLKILEQLQTIRKNKDRCDIILSDAVQSISDIRGYMVESKKYGTFEINPDNTIGINPFLPTINKNKPLKHYWNNYISEFYDEKTIRNAIININSLKDFARF